MSCDFTYKAGQVAGTAQLTGSFVHVVADGDSIHSPSSDTTELRVVAEAETNTALRCAATVSLAADVPCTVEVTSEGSPADVPTGEVAFSSSNAGAGFQPRSCQLDNAGRCQLIYVPTGPPSRTDTLTAAYQGATGSFKASNGTTAIDIKGKETFTELLAPPPLPSAPPLPAGSK